MALIRWEPFRDVEIMQRQINRLFDQMLLPQDSDRLQADVAHSANSIVFAPAAEIDETTDAFKLRIELPGLEPDDLDVKVSPIGLTRTANEKLSLAVCMNLRSPTVGACAIAQE